LKWSKGGEIVDEVEFGVDEDSEGKAESKSCSDMIERI
jgi:hypothetical protein